MKDIQQKITHPKKLAFLENYPRFIRTTLTARAIGVAEVTIYDWRKTDEAFNKAFLEVKKKVETDRLEELEEEMHKRALDKSDLLLIFSVKKLDPSYREKSETHISGDIVFKSLIPEHRKGA